MTLGVLFFTGLAADQLGRRTHLPRVTMLLMLGLIAGQAGLDVVPDALTSWFDALSVIALTMVAFLLGGALTRQNVARHGRAIFAISVSIVLCTTVLVTAGLIAAGMPFGLALLLGAVATATAPAAMTDVIRQAGVKNRFTATLKAVVAIDDAWGLIVFSLALILAGHTDGWSSVLSGTIHDLGGAVLLGLTIGVPSAYLAARLKPGEPLQAEIIGIVFLSAGLSLWLEVSFLVTGMAVGTVMANLARHHERAFHEIERLQWPFMILFFLLAGASLEVEALRLLGWTGALFICLRIVARLAGGLVGARLGNVPRNEAPWYGPALLPQAGVAVGMALVASERFPQWAPAIMAFTITSTVVFEIIGPPATLLAIRRAAGSGPH